MRIKSAELHENEICIILRESLKVPHPLSLSPLLAPKRADFPFFHSIGLSVPKVSKEDS